MTWNGDDNRDPKKPNDPKDIWSRKGKEDGPPDLDKLFKDFFGKLSGTQNTAAKSNSQNTPAFPASGMMWIALVLLAFYFVSGIYIVEPAEQAVVTRFGQYVKTVDPGPHWYARFIENKEVVNVQQVYTVQHEERMLTRDENIVWVEIAVQFQVTDPKAYLFNVVEPKNSLKQATESALRSVIGHSTLDEILTSGRAEITDKVTKQTDALLAIYGTGLVVSDVTMQPARAPNEVKEAFDDVIKAQEDEIREVNRAESYARSREPIARGTAQRALEEAAAYKKEAVLLAQGSTSRFLTLLPEYKKAPEITRQRLYLSMLSDVLGNTPKVLVDGNANNQLLYLPLDQLMRSSKTPELLELSTTQAESKPHSKPMTESSNGNAEYAIPQSADELRSLREKTRESRGGQNE